MSRRQVPADELDFADDTLVYLGDERFTGIAVEDLPGGGRSETEYRLGVQDGLSRTYWPGGGLRTESWYDYGVRLRQRSWYEDGTAQEDVVLDGDGVKHHYRYGPDGTPAETFHRGRD